MNILGVICLLFMFVTENTEARNLDWYNEQRQKLIAQETGNFLGSELVLDQHEAIFNHDLMAKKRQELATAFYTSVFPPARPFYQVKPEIEQSRVFQTLQNLPKGGALHLHDFSITSVDWVIKNVTYRDNLYMCILNSTQSLKFGWFKEPPAITEDCLWMNVQDTRNFLGTDQVDQALIKHLTIITDTPDKDYPNVNSVWDKFGKVFSALFSLLANVPVATDYFYQGFKEFTEDNVQYIEFRTVLPRLCPSLETCQDPLSQVESARIIQQVAEKFIQDHPNDNCGIRMIYAPPRFAMEDQVKQYLDLAVTLRNEMPDFMAGFDLVGQEDKGIPLINFVPILLERLDNIDMPVFFHAGETDWPGQATDLNLFDALLLKTSRIGHGYSIGKHPEAQRLALEKDVPLEVCPISNQVLKLVDDLRNHPASPLIQSGFPIVISSDDPGIWGAKGLSYDFYEAFMALASASMDLRLLKKLALNSLNYTTLDPEQKDKCLNMFQNKWAHEVRLHEPKITTLF